jgi:hypothetical protein
MRTSWNIASLVFSKTIQMNCIDEKVKNIAGAAVALPTWFFIIN